MTSVRDDEMPSAVGDRAAVPSPAVVDDEAVA